MKSDFLEEQHEQTAKIEREIQAEQTRQLTEREERFKRDVVDFEDEVMFQLVNKKNMPARSCAGEFLRVKWLYEGYRREMN